MCNALRELVCHANRELQTRGLVIQNWGNVSGIDREAGVVVIKPSGVPYVQLTPEKMVCLDLAGNVLAGDLRPSSDTPTHLELYHHFEGIGGICHTHSTFASQWAQACREIPCFGTTHADYFYGPIPVTDVMSKQEIENDYELNTGKVIIKRFSALNLQQNPAVLVANHGPFTWGAGPGEALEAAEVLEQVARMAMGTLAINPQQESISQVLLDKYYLRKHGKEAYYGQG